MADLFQEQHRFIGKLDLAGFESVPDPQDRNFAALAAATGATLVSLDEHLLAADSGDAFLVLTPSAFLQLQDAEEGS